MASQAQIVVTLGPSSEAEGTFFEMAKHQADVARLNFSWGNYSEKSAQIESVRSTEEKLGRKIPIIIDLPGPRIQKGTEHSFDSRASSLISETDEAHIKFGVEKKVDYVALSFVGSKADVMQCREIIKKYGGDQKIISKIERKEAIDNFDGILEASDAIMIARGDLGNDLPVEKIPFIQTKLIEKCNAAGKPVITATEMLLSMVERTSPTRAEVTDVAIAILTGSDAVMLSEETAKGRYPVETVAMMEKIISEAERHRRRKTNTL